MKKIVTLIAVAIASMGIAHAQLGIVGGFTSSKTSLEKGDFLENARNVNLYHAGLTYKIDCGAGFAVQPALSYQVKGAALDEMLQDAKVGSLETKTGFLELSAGLQWGPDLLIFRPFVVCEPFVGYALTGDEKVSLSSFSSDEINQSLQGAKNKLEYGFGIGGGVELMEHLQVSVQWFMNLGALYSEDKLDGDAVLKTLKAAGAGDIKNYQGIKVSAAIFF